MGGRGDGLCLCAADKTNGHPTSGQERLSSEWLSETNNKHGPVQVKLVAVSYQLLTHCRHVVPKARRTSEMTRAAAPWIDGAIVQAVFLCRCCLWLCEPTLASKRDCLYLSFLLVWMRPTKYYTLGPFFVMSVTNLYLVLLFMIIPPRVVPGNETVSGYPPHH